VTFSESRNAKAVSKNISHVCLDYYRK